MTTFGLISDVHAQDELLIQALKYFRSQQVDAILCAGDVVDGAGDANRCCDLLQEFGVLTVRGNHDRWLVTNDMRRLPDATRKHELSTSSLDFLNALRPLHELETSGGTLLLCHGAGRNDMNGVGRDDYGYGLEMNKEVQQILCENRFRFVVSGHTHRRMARGFGALTWINPGALVPPEVPSVATLDVARSVVQFHDYANGILIPDGAVRTI
ncbi:MAG TPA: metallophosphoesterase family protein [Abditibacteriaceae bacterium]|jgi:putative phosphoesterase